MTPLQVVIDVGEPDTALQLTRALTQHVRWCRSNGVTVADGLVDALKWAEAVARGLSSPLAGDVSHGEVVEPLILTIPQTAELLGCSVSKVKTLIANGSLPVVLFDGVRRVRRSDVESLVAGTSFRDRTETKATDPAAAGRRLDGPGNATVTALPTADGSATLERTAR